MKLWNLLYAPILAHLPWWYRGPDTLSEQWPCPRHASVYWACAFLHFGSHPVLLNDPSSDWCYYGESSNMCFLSLWLAWVSFWSSVTLLAKAILVYSRSSDIWSTYFWLPAARWYFGSPRSTRHVVIYVGIPELCSKVYMPFLVCMYVCIPLPPARFRGLSRRTCSPRKRW